MPVGDGDVVAVGRRCGYGDRHPRAHVAHLAYALEDRRGSPRGVHRRLAAARLHRAADLLGAAHAPGLAAAQHLGPAAGGEPARPGHVYPTHRFGSFCPAAPSGADGLTLGQERRVNPAFALEETYVATVLAGLDASPAYYARMGRRTRPDRPGRT